jgi:hypothetical protein
MNKARIWLCQSECGVHRHPMIIIKEDHMKRVHLVAVVFLMFGLLSMTTSAMACKAAGKDKHVGIVMNIDQKTGTFTIKDAETENPMTFQATTEQLRELKMKDQVMVSYKEKDGKLVAVDIHS